MEKELTLLQHIEIVVDAAETSKLTDELFTQCQTSTAYIGKVFGISETQALFLSLFINQFNDTSIQLNDLASFLECKNVRIMQYTEDIEVLSQKRLIMSRSSGGRSLYRVPHEVIEAVMKGEAVVRVSHENISIDGLFDQFERLLEERNDGEISFKDLYEELRELLDQNTQLQFVRTIQTYGFADEIDLVTIIQFCNLFARDRDDCVGFSDFEHIFDSDRSSRENRGTFQTSCEYLIDKHIVEYSREGGLGGRDSFRLTDASKRDLLSELQISLVNQRKNNNIKEHASIVEKKLFYNQREQTQINSLTTILEIEQFKVVQDRLVEQGMRKGFACLFYGAPGTGKTETILQIARHTGRDILQVDIAETKSMWFGESEKKIKEVFESYKMMVETSTVTPILLFNEADAVIGKRKNVGQGSVSQTENAIQNIILQEIELLEGILVATTNLTENLDKAFERRFLYKVKFDKPTQEARCKIWQSMLPSLSLELAQTLSSKYDFSGGQIENIARKYIVELVISGKEPSDTELHAFCKTELLSPMDNLKPIGFGVN